MGCPNLAVLAADLVTVGLISSPAGALCSGAAAHTEVEVRPGNCVLGVQSLARTLNGLASGQADGCRETLGRS